MSLKQRINKIEQFLSNDMKKCQDNSDEDIISNWLIENSHEYRECIRQLFRLQCNVNQSVNDWHEWIEPYRSNAEKLLLCMEELRQQNKDVFNYEINLNKNDMDQY